MSKKHYQLTILDSDGDEHHYYFLASMVWMVPQFVMSTMIVDRDFYGHEPDKTQDIAVHEMIMAPKNGIIEIELL